MAKKIAMAAFYVLVAIIIIGGELLITDNHLFGKPPPHITQQTIDGENSMEIINKGPSIIYFWAEWCGICEMMQSAISAVLIEYSGITVAIKSGDSHKVGGFLKEKQLQWHVVNDPNGEIAKQYGVKGVPRFIVINKKGDVGLTTSGYTSEIGMKFRIWLSDIF